MNTKKSILKELITRFRLEGMNQDVYPIGTDFIENVSFKTKNEMYGFQYPRIDEDGLTYDFIEHKTYKKGEKKTKIYIYKHTLCFESRNSFAESNFKLSVDDTINFYTKMPRDIEAAIREIPKNEYWDADGIVAFRTIINALGINVSNVVDAKISNVFEMKEKKIVYDVKNSGEYELIYNYEGYRYSERCFSLLEREDGTMELTLIGPQKEIETANNSSAIIKAQKEIKELKAAIMQFNN